MGLFSFKYIDVSVSRETKSLTAVFRSENKKCYISKEFLFELESLFNWLAEHIEVQSVLLKSDSPFFCDGIEENYLAQLELEELKNLIVKLQTVVFSSYFLPQTIITDVGLGASDLGAELTLASDLRICHEMCHIHFDHLKKGLTPCSGGIGLLGEITDRSTARNWTMGSMAISKKELKNASYILESYSNRQERENLTSDLLERISNQSPVCRIQSKRAHLEYLLQSFDLEKSVNENISYAGLIAEDWHFNNKIDGKFKSPAELKQRIRRAMQSI